MTSVHKDGKKLRFLKSKIDEWLCGGRNKTQEEIEKEAADPCRFSYQFVTHECQKLSQSTHI